MIKIVIVILLFLTPLMGLGQWSGDYATKIVRLDSVYIYSYSNFAEEKIDCRRTRIVIGFDESIDTIGFYFNNNFLYFKEKARSLYGRKGYREQVIYEDIRYREEYVINVFYGKDKPGLLIFITNIEFGTPYYVISSTDICTIQHERQILEKAEERDK